MPRQSVFPALALLVLAGCATLDDYRAQPDAAGVYRPVLADGSHPFTGREGALRESSGALVDDPARATKKLRETGSVGGLFESVRTVEPCWSEDLYRANIAQKAAMAALRNEDFTKADVRLSEVERLCPQLASASAQRYFQAMVANGRGQIDRAKALLQEFLALASTPEPSAFEREPRGTESDFRLTNEASAEHAFYRARAREYVAGATRGIPLSPDDLSGQVAKMYPNNPFRPGGNRVPVIALIPVFSYGFEQSQLLGLTIFRSWGDFAITPSIAADTRLGGAAYGLRLRRSLFESPDRDLNVDVVAYGHSWQDAEFVTNSRGGETQVSTTRSGVNVGAGVGATHRFLFPSLGVSAQAVAEQSTLKSTFLPIGTLYGFYDVTQGIDIFGGFIRNRPMVGVSIQFVQLGYSFHGDRFEMAISGLTF